MEDIKISIVIPSYGSQDSIDLCLTAINKQTLDHSSFETIVVDSSPGYEVSQIVERYPNTALIKQEKKTLPGIARNIGAGKAKGELIVFLDSDVVLEESGLEKIWAFYEKGFKVFSAALNFDRSHGATLIGLTKHFFYKNEYQENRKIESRSYLASSALICEADILKNEEGFKDLPQAEDMEFTERLSRKGYVLFFIPEIVVSMIHRDTLPDLLRKIFKTGFYIYFVRYKKKGLWYRLAMLIILPLLAFVKTIRIIVRNLLHYGLFFKIMSVLTSPIMFVYSFFWMLGLYRAYFFDLVKPKLLARNIRV